MSAGDHSSAPDSPRDLLARYHRQMLLPGIGRAGQESLAASHVLIVGCGALGSIIADSLARAGVGTLTIVDRDIVELTNLQRQILFTESDVASGTPKAPAAAAAIARINSSVRVSAIVDDFNPRNAQSILGVTPESSASSPRPPIDLILDGLDNFETRYLLNDLAVANSIPYVYGGAVGVSGLSLVILPRTPAIVHPRNENAPPAASRITWSAQQSTPCLRCVFPEAPPPGSSPTCDTAGVLGPLVLTIAAHQALQALKILTGNIQALDRSMLSIDVWSNETRRFDVSAAMKSGDCPCCAHGRFDYLHPLDSDGSSASASGGAVSLCGRNAVQIVPPSRAAASSSAPALNLSTLADRLAPHGSFVVTPYLMRGRLSQERGSSGEPVELTLFPNGRAILHGLSDPVRARALYARYVGS